MLVDEPIIECTNFEKGLITFVKFKEDYTFYNIATGVGYYTITSSTCSTTTQVKEGNLAVNESFIFTPDGDGEYTIIFTVGNKKQKIVLTHYPSLIKAVVRDIKEALCNCGCTSPKNDCISVEAKNCLTYQNVFGDISLLTNIYCTIEKCNSKNVIRNFISSAISYYKCNLFSLFCSKELETKLQGRAKYSDKMFKKMIAINYLSLYFYEILISSPLKESTSYINKKFKYGIIQDCILKAGIDISDMKNIFDDITYCEEDIPPVCTLGCITPVTPPTELKFTFETNQIVTGIHHIVNVKNTCLDEVYFFNRLLFKDFEFKVKTASISNDNPTLLLSGETTSVNIIFEGTKSIPTVIKVPYKIDNVLISNYTIEFKDPINPNRPPVITDILKVLSNRLPYTFTIVDFETHFSDPDGDQMAKIELVGDTSRFKLNGIPYVSGTPIDRNNINQLVYIPLDTDDEYGVVVNWKAWDSHGLPSN